MRLIRRIVCLLAAYSFVVMGSAVWAEEKTFAVVDRVDHDLAELVLDDQAFLMALNLKVHDKNGATTMYALKKGEKVYYTLDSNNKVNTVWVLPANTPRPDEDDN